LGGGAKLTHKRNASDKITLTFPMDLIHEYVSLYGDTINMKILNGFLIIVFVLLILSFQVYAQATREINRTKMQIEEFEKSFCENFAKGDAKAMTKGYTKDAIAFPPNAPTARGKDAIQKVFESFIAMGNIDLKLQTDEVGIIGNTAITHGTYRFSLTMKDGNEIHDDGKFLEVWEEQKDGTWLRKYDMWNSSLPPEGNNIHN
jgi:ketosteroid isomerase-like protein